MKARILLLPVLAFAGIGASYALANGGDHHGRSDTSTTAGSCQRTHLHGTASAPQTFTVTVTKAGGTGAPAPGQIVTVSVGQTGQTVGVNVEGCLTGASSLAAKEAELHAFSTVPTGTTGTTGTTTTGGHHGGDDDQGEHHGHHHGQKPPTTSTGTTTAPPTPGG
jgi:hypothetical protein